jgi:hypothetical protein
MPIASPACFSGIMPAMSRNMFMTSSRVTAGGEAGSGGSFASEVGSCPGPPARSGRIVTSGRGPSKGGSRMIGAPTGSATSRGRAVIFVLLGGNDRTTAGKSFYPGTNLGFSA